MKPLPTDSDLAEIYRLASDTRSPYVQAELLGIGERVLVRQAHRSEGSCTNICVCAVFVSLPIVVHLVSDFCSDQRR